jgi:glycosyltransferase involved in cell wall biosynthesis
MKVGRSLGVPVVARSMGSDLNRIGDFISARCTRTVLREADAVVTVSSALRRKAISMGANPETVRTIVNGCDLDAFVPKDQRDARGVLGIDPAAEVVLYIGRMDRKKGLLELVEASADVHRSRPELQVVMLGGNGPDEELVNSAVRKRDASSYIRTVPECAPDKVATWIAAADLVILPSYMEGCPNVILEALACGRPVVATNVGGIPEILNTSCGRLVRARDAAALADAMIQVLNLTWDPEWIRAHASRGWSAVAAEHLELFERLLNREEAFTQHEQLDAADAYRH